VELEIRSGGQVDGVTVLLLVLGLGQVQVLEPAPAGRDLGVKTRSPQVTEPFLDPTLGLREDDAFRV
jgi:hypothetical protein